MPPDVASQSVQLCNHIVRVTREYTGRGPTRARAYVTDDLISVVLQDTLGRGERSLVDQGHGAEVLGVRQAFQRAMGPLYVAGVEEIVQRRVVAFLSANSFDPDVAIESFVLGPAEA
jgi:uncharacterized protein YbcI